jgi:hypothetical protein
MADPFGGSSGTVNTTSTSSPWGPQQPFLQNVFQGAQNLYNQGPYSGPFIGQQSPFTSQYQNLAAQKSLDPNSLTAQGQNQLSATISGQYLNPSSNPYLGAYVNDALGQVNSQFTGMYGGAAGNNINNSGFQEGLARTLSNTALPIYANAYNQERTNQLNASQAAPGMDYANLTGIQAAGASQDARSQAEAQAQQQAYMSPWSNLANYRNAVSGAYGGSQTGQTPYYTNPLGNILGAGIGATALNSLFGNPIGSLFSGTPTTPDPSTALS